MSWLVAHTHVNAEAKALFHLRRQGYEVYLPRYRRTRRHARKVDSVLAPLFPRYLFVACDAETSPWRAICSTVGIANLVMCGGKPAVAPITLVDEIRQREDDEGLVAPNEAARFAPGDKVEIISGPMFDRVGIFDGLDARQRVAVLLQLLGQQVRVRLPLEAVRAVS